jgi:putative proteasome-type protease
MDSTLKSNLSVGLPLDMVVYQADQLQSDQVLCIDDSNAYFKMLRNSWGQKLRQVFDELEDPMWHGEATDVPILTPEAQSRALKKIATPDEKLI